MNKYFLTGSGFGTAMLAIALFTAPAGALLTSQAVMAQGDTLLEEIIVTARKREENVLEIPESLTTFTGDMVESANINGLEDIGLLVPNLWMSRRLDGFPNVSIRGLGAFGNTQGVGFYLDDVQLFGDASSRFGDFERIEVLKGPQGILYGGANIGGAIKFVSQRPDPGAFSGRVKAQAGEDNYYDGEVQLNVPLGNDWALRLFGFAMTDDSYFHNPNSPRLNGGINDNDPDVGKMEKYGIRATLAGNISEQLSVYATLRYNELDGPNNIWIRELTENLTHHNVVDTSYSPRHKRETVGATLELTYDFDSFAVTSVTSYTDTESDRQTDLDISQEFALDLFRPWPVEVWTQELRFTSTNDSPLQWQAGAYYLDYKRDYKANLLIPLGFCYFVANICADDGTPPFFSDFYGYQLPPLDADTPGDLCEGTCLFEYSDRGREQIAGYANVSYRFNNVEIAGGVRVDNWKSERTNYSADLALLPVPLYGQQEETEVLGRGSIAMFFDEDRSMVYGTVSQGFEPGDFNCCAQSFVASFVEERATQYEIGYKGRLLEDRLILTLAGFYIDYKDRQFELQRTDPVTNTVIENITNVGDSDAWGLEGDMVLSVHENWTLSAGFGYIDAEWDGGTLFAGPGGEVIDLSGRTPPNVVDWSATAALDYDQQVNGDMRLFGRLQLRYKGDASTNAQFFDSPGDDFPIWENPDFTVVDLGAGVEWNNWEIGIHVENLFDEDYYIDVQEFPNFAGSALPSGQGAIIIGTLEQPRRVVGSVQYHF
ncbi:MAG: TonB-dependent receptor [Gammaproteobacteria bacterium]|nr:TonB-dependent receptor [Gammaproteobacteria bacterium]